jgi:hypothetical protein
MVTSAVAIMAIMLGRLSFSSVGRIGADSNTLGLATTEAADVIAVMRGLLRP